MKPHSSTGSAAALLPIAIALDAEGLGDRDHALRQLANAEQRVALLPQRELELAEARQGARNHHAVLEAAWTAGRPPASPLVKLATVPATPNPARILVHS